MPNAPSDERGAGRSVLSRAQREEIRDWLAACGDDPAPMAGYQASVRVYRGPAGAFVIKQPVGRGPRLWLGRRLIRREARAYRRLRHVPGVPECYGLIDGQCLVLQYVPGDTLDAVHDDLPARDEFFSMLLTTIREMHEAGVAHGDLKRRKNILVGPGRQPFVVDFGIAVLAGRRRGRLFELVRQVDRNAWIKHKYRGRTEAVAAQDAAIYAPLRSERLMRWLRVPWQVLRRRSRPGSRRG